jgi:hypothetical protein
MSSTSNLSTSMSTMDNSTDICTNKSITGRLCNAQIGKKIYASNRTMRDIATVMEHPEFKEFFDKYFKTADDAQNILQLMKVYEKINRDDPYEKIHILFEAFNNCEIRRLLTDEFIQWRNKGDQLYKLNKYNKFRKRITGNTNRKQLKKKL